MFTNGTDVEYYEVGCAVTCEHLNETAGDVTRITRCCDEHMCNDDVIQDPTKNAADAFSVKYVPIVISILSSLIL